MLRDLQIVKMHGTHNIIMLALSGHYMSANSRRSHLFVAKYKIHCISHNYKKSPHDAVVASLALRECTVKSHDHGCVLFAADAFLYYYSPGQSVTASGGGVIIPLASDVGE